MDVEEADMMFVRRLHGRAKSIRVDQCAVVRIPDVIMVSNGGVVVRQDYQTPAGSHSKPSSDETHAFECEGVLPSEVCANSLQQVPSDPELAAHFRTAK